MCRRYARKGRRKLNPEEECFICGLTKPPYRHVPKTDIYNCKQCWEDKEAQVKIDEQRLIAYLNDTHASAIANK